MDITSQEWKSRRKALRKEGQLATIMRVYVNKTSQPSSFASATQPLERRQIRVPKSPLATRARYPRFMRAGGPAVRRKALRSDSRHSTESESDFKSEHSSLEESTSHALAEQAFAAQRTLFSDFPMPKKGAVSTGLEYFLGVCAPPALGQKPGWNWKNPGQSEYTIWYIQNILRSDILFELIVAYAIALRMHVQKDLEGSQVKQAVAFHTQNALHRLQKRLQKGDAYQDDVVVWAVIMLCGTTYILRELEAFRAHVRGLRQMVALRGGIDSLDKFGFLKRRVINIESSRLATLEHQRQGMLANTTLVYHPPPLSSSILRRLSNFPPGFAELPFKVTLSDNMIDFIEHNLENIRNPPSGPSKINGIHVTDWILSLPLLQHERLIAVALLTNSECLDRIQRAQTSTVSKYRIQREFLLLVQFQASVEADYVQWAVLTLQRTVRFSPELKAWANKLLAAVRLSEASIMQLEARYLPITQLPANLERQPDEM
ncbi:hypothetical protein H2200_002024 [Cladophialophora chaetospira]|uniref:Uncharacterized protein n=1 Tax=Cladophialophora chaetospira TaxID=386627 RepID=A0AA38XIA9_9EURO|nr:hypothetical protein H2200_002024 [Cladophialophora chaetospira]